MLREATGGRGPDAVIEAVGMEAHGTGAQEAYDRAKQLLRMETDRASSLRDAIHAVRKTLRSAQQHGQRYIPQFFDYVQQGDLDPSVLITHDFPLEDGVRAYDLFKNKTDGCIRVALRP